MKFQRRDDRQAIVDATQASPALVGLTVQTREGWRTVGPAGWIVRAFNGHVSVLSDADFERQYEPLTVQDAPLGPY